MLVDTHLHTGFSTDSNMTIEAAMERSREAGMGIIITEHMDLDYPKPQAFLFDVGEYFRRYGPLRSDRVLLGIEIGMRTDLVAENRDVALGSPFDFVLGSIHVIDGIDIYLEEFYLGYTKRYVYDRYFTAMLDCLAEYDFIDSLGHIDYIARYARFEDREVRYSEFQDYIDAVLTNLVRKEKALELNTRRLGEPEAAAALVPIFRRYHELGGRMVTIGSDAHAPQDIGKYFPQALDMVDSCRLRPVYYRERKPQYMKR